MNEGHEAHALPGGFADRLAGLLVRWHWLFFALSLALIALGAVGLDRVRASGDSRAFFGPENPEYQRLLELEDTYTSSEITLVVLAAPRDRPFAPETLDALRDATDAAWYLPYTLRVDSLANFNDSRAEGDDILVEPLLPFDVEITPDRAAAIGARALQIPDLVNRLVSADGTAFGILISQMPPDRARETFAEIQAEVDAYADDLRARLPDHEVFVTGGPMASLAFASAGRRDLRETLPLAAAVTVGLLVVGLRAFAGVTGSILVLAGSAVLTLGAGGWMGMALTPDNSSSPLAVIVLIAATCMHMVLTWRGALRSGQDKRRATHTTLADNLAPITVTNLTTAFGFLCLNFSEAPPLRDLGNMIAAGILCGLALSITLLPTALLVLPAPTWPGTGRIARALAATGDFSLRHRGATLIVFATLVAVSAFGVARISFNDDFVRYFDETYQLRRDAEAIEARLTPLDSVQFSFESPYEGGIFAPAFLNDLERFVAWAKDHPMVVHVSTVTEMLKRLNASMHGDDPAYLRIADSAPANAQLMMLYELNLPVGQDMNAQISIDRDRTLVTIALDIDDSADLRRFAAEAEDWLDRNTPEIASPATGGGIVFARISLRNGTAMFVGTIVVLVVIAGAMVLALGSLRLGALSLVPNLVPAIVAFGLWGVLFGDVNLGSTVVTVMTFGIVVDDTVHLMMSYNRHRRAGRNPADAVRGMLENVGPAITLTSVTICAGFSIIAMSSFALNQHLGALTALVVAAAFLADLFLLPALLIQAERRAEGRTA